MTFYAAYAGTVLYSYLLCLMALYVRIKEDRRFDAIEIVCMLILPPIIWYKIGKILFMRFLRFPEVLAVVFSFVAALYYFLTLTGIMGAGAHADYGPIFVMETLILWAIVPLIIIAIQLIAPVSKS